MTNIDQKTPDSKLIDEWVTRLKQLRNRQIAFMMAARMEGPGATERADSIERKIVAALKHLRKFDWEKER